MLRDALRSREPLRLYGIAPPKASNEASRNREIAGLWTERLNGLGRDLDGVILYDLQDEPGRTGTARPFPFLPTLDPLGFARDHLAAVSAPKVIYKRVTGLSGESLENWLARLRSNGAGDAAVLVGAPASPDRNAPRHGGLTLAAACRRVRDGFPDTWFGGVAIAERHVDKKNEHARLLAKHRDGCRFFVTQTVYDARAMRALVTDYAHAFAEAGIAPVPLIVSYAPCGSMKTLEFMRWLGIRFPGWITDELKGARDILERSVALCEEIGAEIADHARACGVPTGMNVESVSIRREEIEASCRLFRRLAQGPYKPDHYRC
jgi:hypothetical protein